MFSQFKSVDEMYKEVDVVLLKAIKTELKRLIPDPTKGAMLVDILWWVMDEVESVDLSQRARWAKYRSVRALDDQSAIVVMIATIILKEVE